VEEKETSQKVQNTKKQSSSTKMRGKITRGKGERKRKGWFPHQKKPIQEEV